jgi:hypothetical protein
MRWYYWLILVVLIWYVLYYYTSPRKIAILQTSLPEFTFDILLHRQPIVLSEQISDIQTLKDAWFSSNKVDIYQQSVRETDDWKKNKYKYLLLQPVEATEVILYPANKSMTAEKVPPENEKLLAIKYCEIEIKNLKDCFFIYIFRYCKNVKIKNFDSNNNRFVGLNDILK